MNGILSSFVCASYIKAMPEDFLPWATTYKMENFRDWLQKTDIFTEFEIARLVHLMFSLNLISTSYFGYFPRNDKSREYLENAEESFPFRDEILLGLERSASIIQSLELPKNTIWHSKSNAFTLIINFFWHGDVLSTKYNNELRNRLLEFSANVPEDYALAAREAVNNRKQRIIRHETVAKLLDLPTDERPLRRQN